MKQREGENEVWRGQEGVERGKKKGGEMSFNVARKRRTHMGGASGTGGLTKTKQDRRKKTGPHKLETSLKDTRWHHVWATTTKDATKACNQLANARGKAGGYAWCRQHQTRWRRTC